MTRPRSLPRTFLVVGALVASHLVLPPVPMATADTDPSTRAPQPVTYTPAAGPIHQVTHLGQSWPGVDDVDCTPTADKPRPVILLHGTGATGVNNWGTFAPALLNEGYCVFAPTYGVMPGPPLFAATGRLVDHVAEVAAVTDRVLEATGAEQVDVVGHSQGGTVGLLLAKVARPGKVGTMVSIAGYAGGTPAAVPGLSSLAEVVDLDAMGAEYSHLIPDGPLPIPFPSLVDIGRDAPAGRDLYLDGHPFHDGTRYTLLASVKDAIVPPGLGFPPDAHPAVARHVLQDTCPINGADHMSMMTDPQTLDLTLNALDPATAVEPRCTATMPVIGMPGQVPPRG